MLSLLRSHALSGMRLGTTAANGHPDILSASAASVRGHRALLPSRHPALSTSGHPLRPEPHLCDDRRALSSCGHPTYWLMIIGRCAHFHFNPSPTGALVIWLCLHPDTHPALHSSGHPFRPKSICAMIIGQCFYLDTRLCFHPDIPLGQGPIWAMIIPLCLPWAPRPGFHALQTFHR